MRFLALLSIFLAGFTLHICAIYQPVYENPNYFNGTIPPLGQEFIVPYKSFEMLFYALFGLVEPGIYGQQASKKNFRTQKKH